MAEDPHEKSAEQARRDLDRLSEQNEVIGTSAMARAAKKAQSHFAGADSPENDPVELWGRRIGRGLSVIFAIALVIYLVNLLA